jgi:hypothetical protein
MCNGLQFGGREGNSEVDEKDLCFAGSCILGFERRCGEERKTGSDLRGHSQDQDGDVVGTAALERQRDHFLAGFGRRVGLGETGEVYVADHAPETVGAEKKDVAFLEWDGQLGGVRRNFSSGAQGGRENVALGMGLGVFGTYEAALDQAADIRMIASQARYVSAANKIKTAIADVREVQFAIDDRERGTRRPHTVKFRMLDSVTLNGVMCSLECRA